MGFIYKIVIGEDLYIGSTKNKYLSHRQGQHNHILNNPNVKNYNNPLYKFCREHNVKKIICEMLEKVDNENIMIKEQEYINKLNSTLNTNRAYRTEEERIEQKILDRKKQNEKNNEKNKEKNKEKIKCDLCGSIVSKGSLKRHQTRMICRKMWDISLLFTDDEE